MEYATRLKTFTVCNKSLVEHSMVYHSKALHNYCNWYVCQTKHIDACHPVTRHQGIQKSVDLRFSTKHVSLNFQFVPLLTFEAIRLHDTVVTVLQNLIFTVRMDFAKGDISQDRRMKRSALSSLTTASHSKRH